VAQWGVLLVESLYGKQGNPFQKIVKIPETGAIYPPINFIFTLIQYAVL